MAEVQNTAEQTGDRSARGAVREPLEEARAWLQVADGALRDFVDEQPLLAVGGALVAGYLVGRLLARR